MILEHKHVAILGAGPVGLTMAKLLQQNGVDVTVYERDKDQHTRIWGGTLDLHRGTGQTAMEKAGLLESYFANARPMGRTLTDEHANIFFSKEPDYDSPEINRNQLREILLNSLKNETVVWDSRFTSLENHDDKWVLHFENKPDATADFVIVANGGMSKARAYVTDTQVENTGTFIIQGEVNQPANAQLCELCGSNILMTAAEGITFVANPDNNGTLAYGVTFRKSHQWIGDHGLNFLDPFQIHPGDLAQVPQQGAAHDRKILAQGVAQGPQGRVVAQGLLLAIAEAQGHGLEEAQIGQPGGQLAALEILRRQRRGGTLQGRQQRRNQLVTPQPQHFLGQILGQAKIAAPAGRDHPDPVISGHQPAPQALQQGSGRAAVHGRAGHPVHHGPGQQDRLGRDRQNANRPSR